MIWLLSFGYVAVAAIILALSASARWSLPMKVSLIAAVTASYFSTYLGYRALEGWPSGAELPEQFRVNWIVVEEPDKRSGDAGAIYFWVRALREGEAVGEPRAHELPYDQAVAEAAEAALQRIEDGATLNGFFTRQLVEPAEVGMPEEGTPSADRFQTATGTSSLQIEFRDVPPATLPPKGPM